MKVLVTGAAGNMGSAVCRTLTEAGLKVVAADCMHSTDLPVELNVVDLLDFADLYPLLGGCRAVVHLANHLRMRSRRPLQVLYGENVAMNMNVFQAAAEVGVEQILYSSSVQAIAGTREGPEGVGQPSGLPYLPLDGDVPARPGNAYALSKQAGEQQLQYFARIEPDLTCTAVRFPSLPAGPRPRTDPEQPGTLDTGFSYLHVEDAARLVLALLRRPEPGYRQLLPGARDNRLRMPIPEVIRRFYPDVPLKVPAGEMESLVDISGIRQQFDWEPRHEEVFK
jgi:nucleoside-diphosphate-sugar epimerase